MTLLRKWSREGADPAKIIRCEANIDRQLAMIREGLGPEGNG